VEGYQQSAINVARQPTIKHRQHNQPLSVRPSVRQSICAISQTQQRRAAGLLLSAVRAKDIDRQRRAPGSNSAAARAATRRSAAKCGQCHVDNRINEAGHRLGLLSFLGLLKF